MPRSKKVSRLAELKREIENVKQLARKDTIMRAVAALDEASEELDQLAEIIRDLSNDLYNHMGGT